jgi:hypothetical protein
MDYQAYEREVEGRYFGRGKEHNLRASVLRLPGSDGTIRFHVSTEHGGKRESFDFEQEDQVRHLIRSRGWQKEPPPPLSEHSKEGMET